MDRALTDAVWIFAAILVLVVLAAAVLATRRFLVERAGGTVECALRRPVQAGGRPVASGGGGRWRLGVLAYQRDEICWFPAFGVLARPDRVFQRRALSVVARRPAEEAEAMVLGADRFVIEVAVKPAADACGSPPGEHVELAMTTEAMTGFLAWLEAAPPGSHLSDLG